MKNKIAVGVDIGGSHVTCQLFDLEKHRLIEKTLVRKKVNGQGGSDEILNSWAEAIAETCKDFVISDLAGIGFAMPGPFDYPGGIAWFENVGKFDNLFGADVRKEIQNRLQLEPDFPVRFLNDAACFAVGESLQGEAAKHQRLLAITLGTGFGTTFIDKHLPVAGKYEIPDDGFLYRVPFKDAVADEYFSTRWFIREYESVTGRKIAGVKEIAKEAESEEKVAAIFTTFGENLGGFLVPWLRRFEADCLVIGGNISAAYQRFETVLKNEFKKGNLSIPVYISTLQEDAALAGSAYLCDNDFYNQLIK
jgi:glucokinase